MISVEIRRVWAWRLLALYGLVLAWILLNPSADPSASTVGGVAQVLEAVGVPAAWVAGARVEFGLNALMFAPVVVLGSVVLPRFSASDWVAALFLGSLAVEAAQGLFLAGRSAQTADVVANTLGAVIGVVAFRVLTRSGVLRVTT